MWPEVKARCGCDHFVDLVCRARHRLRHKSTEYVDTTVPPPRTAAPQLAMLHQVVQQLH